MDLLSLLEQGRFALEFLAAALVMSVPVYTRKTPFAARLSASVMAMTAITAVCLGLGSLGFGHFGRWMEWILYMCWQVLLMFVLAGVLLTCFEIRGVEIIITVTNAYALRQICDIVINEMLTDLFWEQMQEHLGAYFLFCLILLVPLYTLYSYYNVGIMKAAISHGIRNDAGNRIVYGVLLMALLVFSFGGGYLFLYTADHVHLMVCFLNLAACLLIPLIQTAFITISAMEHDRQLMEQLMVERQKQYEMSGDVVAALNHKCHDLKNQLLALQSMSQSEQSEFFREASALVSDYDLSVHTESEVLNVLLLEKLSYCRNHDISFTYMADGSGLSFMTATELYTLLGNAIDNAIECVMQYDSPEQRMISMNIAPRKGCLCIQVVNCFEGKLAIEDGLPVSTKGDALNHGFGTRSMQMVAQRYGGEMSVSAEEGMFVLDVVIPIP